MGEAKAARECRICGKVKEMQAGRAKCSACRSKAQRAKARERRNARVDVKEHDYANKRLPAGYRLRGVSQQVDGEGNVLTQWLKSERYQGDRLEEFLECLEVVLSNVKGKAPKIAPPKPYKGEDLLNILPIGDAHIGLMTWCKEVGESYDLEIAQGIYQRAFDAALATAPKADTLLILNVGDYFHSDGGKNTTTKGTPVDVDGRWGKVFSAGIEILCYAIERGLETHKNVHLVCAAGNHDAEAAIALSACLRKFYSKNPRVKIDEGISKFHFFRHGSCLIGCTHGDTVKAADLPLLMAHDRKEDWGETTHRHWYTGHIHHESVKDMAGCTVESVRVLVPTDAWHHGQGYRSGRDIRLVTWHKERGRIGQNIFGIDMLRV